MVKKILLLAATVLAALALLTSPVSAQYPEGPSATIDDTSVLAGQAVRIQGECHTADSVSLEIQDGPSLGTIAVAADGTFDGSVTIPSDLAPGEYTLLLTCGTEVLSTTITVLAAGSGGGTTGGDLTGGTGSGSGDGSLARTGTEVDGLLKIGGGLLVAGAAAVLFTTKRRSASA